MLSETLLGMCEIIAAALLFASSLCAPASTTAGPQPPPASAGPLFVPEPSEAREEWDGDAESLFYAVPHSDIIHFRAACTPEKKALILVVVSPKGDPGQKTSVTFARGKERVSYDAVVVEGMGGNETELLLPVSAKLFKMLQADGFVVAQVPGGRLSLPAEGRTQAVQAFVSGCR